MSLHHVALGASDVERVAVFWRDVLGLTQLERHLDEQGDVRSIWLELGHGAILMIERTALELSPLEGPVVGAGPFLIALSVTPERRAALERELERAGHPIEARTTYTSYFRDPEGNRVAISHYPKPAS